MSRTVSRLDGGEVALLAEILKGTCLPRSAQRCFIRYPFRSHTFRKEN